MREGDSFNESMAAGERPRQIRLEFEPIQIQIEASEGVLLFPEGKVYLSFQTPPFPIHEEPLVFLKYFFREQNTLILRLMDHRIGLLTGKHSVIIDFFVQDAPGTWVKSPFDFQIHFIKSVAELPETLTIEFPPSQKLAPPEGGAFGEVPSQGLSSRTSWSSSPQSPPPLPRTVMNPRTTLAGPPGKGRIHSGNPLFQGRGTSEEREVERDQIEIFFNSSPQKPKTYSSKAEFEADYAEVAYGLWIRFEGRDGRSHWGSLVGEQEERIFRDQEGKVQEFEFDRVISYAPIPRYDYKILKASAFRIAIKDQLFEK